MARRRWASIKSMCSLEEWTTSKTFPSLPGTRLYREPASKSNRSIILNAIEYVVFPGVVNAETRNRVLVCM